jgi:hypothetical protein
VVQGLRPILITNGRLLSYEERRELTEQLGNQESRGLTDVGLYNWFELGTAILEQGAGGGMGHAGLPISTSGTTVMNGRRFFPLSPEGELDEHLSSQEKSSAAEISSAEAALAPPAEVGGGGGGGAGARCESVGRRGAKAGGDTRKKYKWSKK